MKKFSPYTLSIAPMMDCTDRHYRFFMRQITKRSLLYTPMITAEAIIRGKRKELLAFSSEEHPVALQLGGDDPHMLAEAARIGEEFGYCEANINVGCPSDRVKNGNFGATLMARPKQVAEIVAAMKGAVSIPVTVKHRMGIDTCDQYDDVAEFISIVKEAKCDRFIVHARKAWLKGLSPKENRTVPPLRYDEVYQLKRDFADQTIVINGGIKTLQQVEEHLKKLDGCMLGRAAYDNPFLFVQADAVVFGENAAPPSREDIVKAMTSYAERWIKQGVSLNAITRHMMGLYQSLPGARKWRRLLSELNSRS